MMFYLTVKCLRQSECSLISEDTLCQAERGVDGMVISSCLCHDMNLADPATGLCDPGLAAALQQPDADNGWSRSRTMFLNF